MYFPSGPPKILGLSQSPDGRVISLVPNKRSTLFIILKSRSFELWNVRPATRLSVVERSTSSLSKYGSNVSLAWTPNGTSLVVLTSTSHVLDYVLQTREQPGDDVTPLNPPIPIDHITTFPPSAGEGFITPYASSSTSKHSAEQINLDSALDDVQGGQAGEGPVKDGLFRYTYSSLGFGVDVLLNGIAKLGRGKRAISEALNFLEGMPGRGTGLLMVVQDEAGSSQQIISVPYPLKPDHLAGEDSEEPVNMPSTVQLPTQTSTSISGAGTSTRFGAGLLGALSGRSGTSGDKGKPAEWVALDDEVEVNVDVVKWTIGTDIQFPGLTEGGFLTHLESTKTHGWYIGRTLVMQVVLCRYHRPTTSRRSISLLDSATEPLDWVTTRLWPIAAQVDAGRATVVSLNARFGVYTVGLDSGKVVVLALPRGGEEPKVEWTIEQDDVQVTDGNTISGVKSLAWTSDGCGLAIGWERGWGLWTVTGRQTFFSTKQGSIGEAAPASPGPAEPVVDRSSHNSGIQLMTWTAGNNELVKLEDDPATGQCEASMLPIMRSSTVSQLNPSEQPMFVADDTIRIYRGRSWTPSALLDPHASPWQNVKVNSLYAAVQWPIRHCCVSGDGTLLAIAGRNGLVHWSANTGRWKMFISETEEASFSVKGGMMWYHHVLIVASESARGAELRLYSRDQELSHAKCLDTQALPHAVVTMTLQGSILLVLTSDNTLYHYSVTTTRDTIRLVIGDSMSLQGLNPSASKVRALCGFSAGHGDLGYDLLTSTIVLLSGTQLVVLEPKKGAHGGTRYESRLLSGGVESFYKSGAKTNSLRRSLWGTTKERIIYWPDVTEQETIGVPSASYPIGKSARASFKPRAVLSIDDPIAILQEPSLVVTLGVRADSQSGAPYQGIQQESGVVLYLPQWLEYFLRCGDASSAYELALASQDLPYFAHSLEILLRATIEGSKRNEIFSDGVVRLLDCFPEGLDVAAAYTRKTEVEHWGQLFDLIGDPRDLFERCLNSEPPRLYTASRYLIAIKHRNVTDGFEIQEDTTRLLEMAFEAGELELCKQIIRFLDSVDATGYLKTQSLEHLTLATEPQANGMLI